MKRDRIAIVDGVRTPFAKAGGAFRDLSAQHLGRIAIQALLARTAWPVEEISEVILGNVAQPAEAMNVARVAALLAGLPKTIPAYTVHRNCASGMEAITSAAEKIGAGVADAVVAGGTESMSQIPLLYPRSFATWFERLSRAKTPADRLAAIGRFRPSMLKPRIGLREGLTDYVCDEIMGLTAERLAREWAISREEQDIFALRSHRRALAERDLLRDEIEPVLAPPRYESRVADDDGPRPDTSAEKLAHLRPIFDRRHGTVTAGNSAQVTDGACAVLVAKESRAKALGIEPLGYLRAYAYAGLEPERMGLGPAHATPVALDRAGASLGDVELVEVNEAFAAQVIACVRAMASSAFARAIGRSAPTGEIREEILNVHGGAIALGHPVGTSGARLVVTLLREMRRRGLGLGLATLCVGGGQGAALVLER